MSERILAEGAIDEGLQRLGGVAASPPGNAEPHADLGRTGHVAGLSNAFSPRRSFDWSGCLDAAWRRVGDVPLVGYERGADLERALDSGFEALGPLCIWERRGATP